jgi:hypothetical protein
MSLYLQRLPQWWRTADQDTRGTAIWTDKPETITLTELDLFTREEPGTIRLSEHSEPTREETVSQQQRSHAEARELAENIVWYAKLMDDIEWVKEQTEARKAQPPTASEFSLLVEAEIAKGLTEVEALHAVAAEYPKFYEAYRNEVFLDGHI